MPVTLAAPEKTITLPSPVPGAEHIRRKRQAVGRSAGGDLYVYDKGEDARRIAIKFESLDDSARDALEEFFAENAQGRSNSFTYIDSEGVEFDARFADSELRFTKIARNVWDITLSLEIEDTTE